MSGYFEGTYYKHQKGSNTLCIIVGRSNSKRFIQVITKDFSVEVPFTNDNIFTNKGIKLNICTKELTLKGKIRYGKLSPIKYDIMGPFCLFPMECRHGIISMHHRLKGKVELNGEMMDFNDGIGYMEKDSGRSFPSSYVWVHANDFSDKTSIMASVADIPFYGLNFRGCICIIQYQGKEYRLATYLGVRVILCKSDRIILKQGKYRLEIRIKDSNQRKLSAPQDGEMTREIMESASCRAEFIFYKKNRQIFHLNSLQASFEYEEKK